MSAPMTPEQVELIKGEVMTLEYQGCLWVCAEDYLAEHEARVSAEAAQALVLEQAAEACEDVDFVHEDPSTQRMVREVIGFAGARIRALAPASGVEALAALRAAANAANEHWLAKLDAEAERDTLAAQVEALKEAWVRHIKNTDAYNAKRAEVLRRRAEGDWSLKLDDEYKAMDQSKRDFLGVAQDIASAALEARHG